MSLLSNLRGARKPLLCYVTDRHSLRVANSTDSIEALMRKIAEVAAAGVDWVQIREKDLTARELASLTEKSLRIAARSFAKSSFPTRVLVNDRLDIAIAERAGGVHLGENSLSIGAAKQLIRSAPPTQARGESFLAGVSCHSLEAAEVAQRDGADYIFFGPIFATPSKGRFGPPQGAERLEQVGRRRPHLSDNGADRHTRVALDHERRAHRRADRDCGGCGSVSVSLQFALHAPYRAGKLPDGVRKL